jgi:twitching motility protein PilT
VVNSLLTAILRADGDALVMHVGEKPYVVTPLGPVELSSRPLTLEGVAGMLAQLLPEERRRALDELGAIEHDLPLSPVTGRERFTVVAARGGSDIWIEIRRHRAASSDQVREAAALPAPAVPAPEATGEVEVPLDVEQPAAGSEIAAPAMPAPESTGEVEVPLDVDEPAATREPDAPAPPIDARPEQVPLPPVLPSPALGAFAVSRPARQTSAALPPSRAADVQRAPEAAESGPAVVLPLARSPIRADAPAQPATSPQIAGLERLLRLATARGANTLYLMSGLRPSIRLDGEISAFDGEPVLTAAEVESLLLDLAPERTREALEKGLDTEWMSDVPNVGRFRCQSFRDHRGPGGMFRLIASRPASVEQLGLSRELQALCAESEGLILVAGPRSSGKSTLISAFVDLINRTRADYVITIESQVACAHDSRGCLVSQREVRGDSGEVAAAVRAALRENPDVLVIEDLRSPDVVALALDAMEAGRLVIGALPAHTATAAIGRILDQFPAERRDRAQLMLADGLRGVVSQVLVRKTGGGRVAAREVLLNTSAIASLIAEGRISQLPAAIDSGRKLGMVPLNDALAGFVQVGIVDVKDAYRKASDRQGFLAVLRREGVDTSFVERRA